MKDTEDQFNETTKPPSTSCEEVDRFENGGLPVQLVLYQQTLVLYRIFTKTLREECSGGVRRRVRTPSTCKKDNVNV